MPDMGVRKYGHYLQQRYLNGNHVMRRYKHRNRGKQTKPNENMGAGEEKELPEKNLLFCKC